MTLLPAINDLRTQVARLTGLSRGTALPCLSIGLQEIDRKLPRQGLARGGVHEVYGELSAATGFLAALLGRQRPSLDVLWVTPQDALFAPGLSQFGLDHRRLTIAWASRPGDRLWAAEEGMKDLPHGAVVAEVDRADLTAVRRLQLAAEASGSVNFLIRRDRQPSSALTRWHIQPASSRDGRPTWQIALDRQRGSEAGGVWLVEWDNATLSFNLASEVAHRQIEAAE